jgi:hypothetical protein
MKSKSVWFLIAIAVLVSFAGWTIYAQRSVDPSPKRIVWEYKIINSYMSEQMLNNLGAQGWELVQYDPGVRGAGGSTSESFIFKRTK